MRPKYLVLEPLGIGAFIALLAAAAGSAIEGPLVSLEFLVSLPAGTPPGEPLYLAGNARALGGWSPRGLALTRLPDGRIRGTRFWLDMGTLESRPERSEQGKAARSPIEAAPIGAVRALAQVLERAGLRSGQDYRYQEIEGGKHDEAAWSARLDQVLLFLYGPPPAARPPAAGGAPATTEPRRRP